MAASPSQPSPHRAEGADLRAQESEKKTTRTELRTLLAPTTGYREREEGMYV